MNSKGRIDRNASPQDTTDSQYPSVNLSAGQHLHGFEVKAVTPIDELRAVAIELLHPYSGGTFTTSLYRRHQKPIFNQSNNTNIR